MGWDLRVRGGSVLLGVFLGPGYGYGSGRRQLTFCRGGGSLERGPRANRIRKSWSSCRSGGELYWKVLEERLQHYCTADPKVPRPPPLPPPPAPSQTRLAPSSHRLPPPYYPAQYSSNPASPWSQPTSKYNIHRQRTNVSARAGGTDLRQHRPRTDSESDRDVRFQLLCVEREITTPGTSHRKKVLAQELIDSHSTKVVDHLPTGKTDHRRETS